jgi:hypothetical protein
MDGHSLLRQAERLPLEREVRVITESEYKFLRAMVQKNYARRMYGIFDWDEAAHTLIITVIERDNFDPERGTNRHLYLSYLLRGAWLEYTRKAVRRSKIALPIELDTPDIADQAIDRATFDSVVPCDDRRELLLWASGVKPTEMYGGDAKTASNVISNKIRRIKREVERCQ